MPKLTNGNNQPMPNKNQSLSSKNKAKPGGTVEKPPLAASNQLMIKSRPTQEAGGRLTREINNKWMEKYKKM